MIQNTKILYCVYTVYTVVYCRAYYSFCISIYYNMLLCDSTALTSVRQLN